MWGNFEKEGSLMYCKEFLDVLEKFRVIIMNAVLPECGKFLKKSLSLMHCKAFVVVLEIFNFVIKNPMLPNSVQFLKKEEKRNVR